MKKNRIVLATSGILSVLAIVGCSFKGNTDMQTDSKVNCTKWDNFANKMGMQTCAQAVPATNKDALVASLKVVPTNLKPDGLKYHEVSEAAASYIKKMIPKTQATEVVSIKKLADVLKEAGFTDQLEKNDKIISVPYYTRDGSYQDLSGIKSLSGINDRSEYKIYGTTHGIVDESKIAEGTVYVLTYKLNGSSQKYSSIISIPNKLSDKKVPLMMYAHGGDAGISFRNMATILQDNLKKSIVAAPSFPGEPICSIMTIGGSIKNNFQRSCGDALGNKMDPAVYAEGNRSPLDDDVNAFLGLHNAISKLAQDQIYITGTNEENFVDDLKKSLAFYSDIPLVNSIAGPQTIGAADSRGGATLMAAVGRTGIMLEQALKGGLDFANFASMPRPALFSSAAVYYSPSSLLVGSFRLLTQYMMSGNINATSAYNALPMIPDLKNNPYFTNYRNAPIGQDQKELNELVGWAAVSDIVYLAPYLSVGMQNWSVALGSLGSKVNEEIGKLLADIGSIQLDAENDPTTTISNTLGSYFIALSKPVSKTDPKSMLNYFADSLRDTAQNPPTGEPKKCNFETDPTNKTSCSIYNILVNGQDAVSIMGMSIPKLDPFIKPEEVLSFASFLDTLGKNGLGLYDFLDPKQKNKIKVIFNILANPDIKKIPMDKMESFVVFLSSATLVTVLEGSPNLQEAIGVAIGSLINLSSNMDKIKLLLPTLEEKLKEELKPLLTKIMTQRKSSPGSIIFMHATQDTIVPFTQSIIAKNAMDTVFDSVYGTPATGFHNPLIDYGIPALGSQLFTFQPDQKFYNVAVGSKSSDGNTCFSKNADGTIPTNYSSLADKCFGNYSLTERGDGTLAHGDSAVGTSRLVNASYRAEGVDPQDLLLYGTSNPEQNILTQFTKFNEAYNLVNPKGGSFTFYSTNCGAIKTGICYLWNADKEDSSNPLFNRTMLMDVRQKTSMFDGGWDSTAQESQITPSDIFSAWMDSSAKKSLTFN